MSQVSRRSFMKSALAAGAFPFLPGCMTFGKDKVRMACIGIGGQPWNDMREFDKTGLVEYVAFCDTDMGAEPTLPALQAHPDVPRFRDFRKMFDAMDGKLDAVLVGTPDFSHFPCTMEAIRRGIPVYVEKPLAHTFEECELLMAAEKKYGVICQMGNQGHSGNNYFQFKEYVEKGVFDLSKLTKLVAHMNNPRRWHKWKGNVTKYPSGEQLPKGLDWDTWLATAQYHDYSKDYVRGEWRCWYDFGNGCLGDWGAHTMDTMHRFFELGLPTEVQIRDVTGWNPFVFPMQDTLTFKFAAKGRRPAIDLEWYEGVTNKPQLPKGYRALKWGEDIPAATGSTAADAAKALTPGKFFYFKDGTAWQGGSHSSAMSICGSDAKLPDYPKATRSHYENFLRAVMGEDEVHSPFSVTAPLSQVFCLGCIAQRLNRGIKFDPATKRIVGDSIADAMLKGPAPRKGWEEYYKV